MKKDLTKIHDLTPNDVRQIVAAGFEFKERTRLGVKRDDRLHGRVIAMVFEKPSLRTKVAFEVAAASLGATPVFLSSSQILASGGSMRGRESIPDIARNLERFADLVLARTYSHQVIREIADSISIPVINALCDRHHPTQALADIMAILWHRKEYKGIKVAFVGDGNNVATSLMQVCAMMGMHFSIATPKGFEIPIEEQTMAADLARRSGCTVEFLTEPGEAVRNADVVYTDTFVSMGQESDYEKRIALFEPYQVNDALMALAKKDALFMHCLPAHRGEEVTSAVMDSSNSIVFDQAECRLHIAKALLSLYL